MTKYRTLTKEELQGLKDEFVTFLSANGIDADYWEQIKTESKEAMEGVIDAFSDMIFDKVLGSCRYIDFDSPRYIASIYCDQKKMYLKGLELGEEIKGDLTDNVFFEKIKSNPPSGCKLISGERPYDDREMDIWNHLQQGFYISNHKRFAVLSAVENSKLPQH